MRRRGKPLAGVKFALRTCKDIAPPLVFFVSKIAGMYAYGTLHVIGSHDSDGGAGALDEPHDKP